MKRRRKRSGRAAPTTGRKGGFRGSGMRFGRWLLGGLLAGVLAFGIGYLIAILVLFPRPALAGNEVVVPDLSGQTLSEAGEVLSEIGLTAAEVRTLANPTIPRGVIVAQSPVPGQRLEPGASVRLAVSGGPAAVVVPNLEGLTFTSARELVERRGLQVARRNEISTEAAPGTVIRTEPAASEEIRVGGRVTLIVSEAVPAPAFQDSLGPAPLDTSDLVGARDTTGAPAGSTAASAAATERSADGASGAARDTASAATGPAAPAAAEDRP